MYFSLCVITHLFTANRIWLEYKFISDKEKTETSCEILFFLLSLTCQVFHPCYYVFCIEHIITNRSSCFLWAEHKLRRNFNTVLPTLEKVKSDQVYDDVFFSSYGIRHARVCFCNFFCFLLRVTRFIVWLFFLRFSRFFVIRYRTTSLKYPPGLSRFYGRNCSLERRLRA